MPNSFFQFKQFIIHQDLSAMKVTTDACLFGAWVAREISAQNEKVSNILEIGTGTGVLSLMIAQQTSAMIDSVEIDTHSAEQAKHNIDQSPWQDRIRLFRADARKFAYPHKYDVIFSNPPFYEKEIRSEEENKNLARHSKELSLKDLLSIIADNLADGGCFFLLFPYKRNKELENLLKQQSFKARKIIFARQSPQHDFFRVMLEGSIAPGPSETSIGEITIWNQKQEYTEEFKSLLNKYYLNL